MKYEGSDITFYRIDQNTDQNLPNLASSKSRALPLRGILVQNLSTNGNSLIINSAYVVTPGNDTGTNFLRSDGLEDLTHYNIRWENAPISGDQYVVGVDWYKIKQA